MLKLHAFAKVNALARGRTRDLRVLWALEEMRLPFELVGMNHLAGEAQVTRWCFAAMNSVEPPLMNLLFLDWIEPASRGDYRAFLVGWANRVLTNLERWFADRAFVATDDFTVADILMASVLANIKDESLIAPYPGVVSYRDRCVSRPAWTRTIEDYFARVEAG